MKIKQATWCLLLGFCWGITPFVFFLADLHRGYNGTGGEIFVPLFPLILLLAKDPKRKEGKNVL